MDTLVDVLAAAAAADPSKVAFTYLADGEGEAVELTYGELDARARATAARLQAQCAQGDRALLLYPPGLDYVSAFFGCLYAGVVAVPAYPPSLARLSAALARLQAIAEEAHATVVLTTGAIAEMKDGVMDLCPQLGGLRWIATDGDAGDAADGWRRPALAADGVAFLQFTSGSTASPRGVVLTHENLLVNLAMIRRAMRAPDGVVAVSWLPPYHDMGLIGMILGAVHSRGHGVLMSPLYFLQKPVRWLRAISRYRAAVSGGPNFAYELCLRKISAADREALDLASWEVAFNGAEPLRADTCERFAEAFAACGFRAASMFPCYGLAESTLMVTASGGAGPVTAAIDKGALERGAAVTAGTSSAAVRLVSSGRAQPGTQVEIVDATTRSPCPAGTVGEIWVAGRSVAAGYFGRPGATADAFHARLATTGQGGFLRTGDLGFVQDGELFVTGRLKDLIVVKGRKLHPQDLEATVERCHPMVRAGGSAAFAFRDGDEDRVAIVAALDRWGSADADAVLGAIRRAIADEHQLAIAGIDLVKPGEVPKTSSGKIQRYACRASFLAGELEAVARWRAAAEATPAGTP